MKTKNIAICLIMLCSFGLAGGCAKTEMVKKEEPIASSTNAAAKSPTKAEPLKEQPVKQAPVKESTIKETIEPIQNTAELKAALEKVFFGFDSYDLSPEARTALAKNAELIKKDPAAAVRIEGNCDERGSDEYNLALGEKRARVAMQYLVTMGVPADHLSVISYGKEKPADSGHNEAAWAKNRRDDFILSTK